MNEIILLLQKQQDEIKALLLAHKREIVELLIKQKENKND